MPVHSSGVPKAAAKGFKTGLLAITLLIIAKKPITQMVRKRALLARAAVVVMDY